MTRLVSGTLAIIVAALIVTCKADPHQDQDGSANEHGSPDRFDSAGHKTRNLDSLGGGNLVRQVRESRRPWVPYMIPRPIEYSSPFGLKRELWPISPMEFGGYFGDGLPKRNFDEIDRSGLDNFVKKRNFDEIDHTNMPFPYAVKRFMRMMGHEPSFEKRNPREYPMDEIDLSRFPIGSKRSYENYPLIPRVL